MEPCHHTPAIHKIEEKLDKVVEALQVLAVQKNEIEHLIKTQGDHRAWLKGHEERIQHLEKRPGESASRFVWLLTGGGISALTGVLIFIVTRG